MLSTSFEGARWRSPVTRLLRNSADLGQTGLHKSTCEDQDPRRKLRWHAGRRRLRGVTRGTLTAGRTGGQRGRGSQLDGGGRPGGPGRARSGEDGTRRGRTAAYMMAAPVHADDRRRGASRTGTGPRTSFKFGEAASHLHSRSGGVCGAGGRGDLSPGRLRRRGARLRRHPDSGRRALAATRRGEWLARRGGVRVPMS